MEYRRQECLPSAWYLSKVSVKVHQGIEHSRLCHYLIDIRSFVGVQMQHAQD